MGLSFLFFSSGVLSEKLPPKDWGRVLDAVVQEPRLKDSYKKLLHRAVEAHPGHQAFLLRAAEFYVREKDRAALHKYLLVQWDALECGHGNKASRVCSWLKEYWMQNLDTVLFYDVSASDLEEFRLLLGRTQCAEARSLIGRIIQREGESRALLKRQLQVAECLEDQTFKARVEEKLRQFEELDFDS